jgi:hypothetical protein
MADQGVHSLHISTLGGSKQRGAASCIHTIDVCPEMDQLQNHI